MNKDQLHGCITAIITPMHENEAIDYAKLEMLVEDQVRNGCGILACGTTGQGWALTDTEHVAVAKHIYHQIAGRVPFMVASGSNSTTQAIELTKTLEKELGPQMFLQVNGYYSGSGHYGAIRHFTRIADALEDGSSLVLYNVPSRTSFYLQPDTLIELARHPRIVGLKQAVDFSKGQFKEDTERVIRETNLHVLSGEDGLVYEILQLGGKGVISASANVAPRIFAKPLEYLGMTKEHHVKDFLPQKEIAKLVFAAKNPLPLARMFNTHVRGNLDIRDCPPEKVAGIANFSADVLGIDLARYAKPL